MVVILVVVAIIVAPTVGCCMAAWLRGLQGNDEEIGNECNGPARGEGRIKCDGKKKEDSAEHSS